MGSGGLDGSAVAEDQYIGILVMAVDDVVDGAGDSLHMLTVGFAAWETHVGADFRIEQLAENLRVIDLQLLPRLVFALAVEFFSERVGLLRF